MSATACDDVGADKPVEEDAAVDDAAIFCPIALYEDAVRDAGSAVEAAPSDFANGTLVETVKFGLTVMRTLM